ncbi:MAG: glycosyltransferase family 39 protein [Candidatus Magnetominusculus sp. LBB02]|nr:glycosyltransferase family 39 protein [Candidatus Magnetominusculus sp. LBB02]
MAIRNAAAYVFILVLAAFLIFYHIGERPMWGDELTTALLAVNIEKFGLPKVSDGRNTITYLGGGLDADKYGNWTWSPWLSEYLAAGSFKLFGQTTTAARLPFAIVGFLSVALLAFVVYRIYGSHEIAAVAAVLLSTSEAFILHVRQCRYYSLVVFAGIILIWGVYALLNGKKRLGTALVAAALITQFYTNYIVIAGSIAALVALYILSRKRYDKLWQALVAALIILALAALPWAVYAGIWRQAGHTGRENIAEKVVYYLYEMNFHIAAIIIFIVPLIVRKPRSDSQPVRDIERFLWILMPATAALVALAPGIFLRYLLPLFPAACILQAAILRRYIATNKIARLVIVLILILTNYAAYIPFYPMKLLEPSNITLMIHPAAVTLPSLIRQTYTPYADRTGDIIAFLKREGADGQSVFTADSGMALVFYNGMKIINAKTFQGDMKGLPDWIFTESVAVEARKSPAMYPSEEIAAHYTPIVLTVHASRKSGSIPEPDMHEPFTSPNMEELLIFRKKALIHN